MRSGVRERESSMRGKEGWRPLYPSDRAAPTLFLWALTLMTVGFHIHNAQKLFFLPRVTCSSSGPEREMGRGGGKTKEAWCACVVCAMAGHPREWVGLGKHFTQQKTQVQFF